MCAFTQLMHTFIFADMSDDPDDDGTASLMTPAKLAQLKMRPQAPATPAAWLDQMATDAGSGHVRRLVDIRKQLEAQAGGPGCQAVASTLEALHTTLGKLDYTVVQPRGWLARATGKGKEEAASFIAQHGRIGRAGEDLADEVRALQKKQQARATGLERTYGEVSAEVQALEKIMDQGARWLQDMRTALKTRQAEGGDAATQQQIRQDTARCELLFARLKQLRAASSAVQQAVERCKTVTRSRVSLGESLQETLDGEWTGWQRTVAALLEEVTATGAITQGVGGAREAQGELEAALRQAGQACRALNTQEQALADEIAALQEPLQAAA
ncbi:MAG: hypothetical protein JWP22_2391 [Ramlibacter sp.]|jgi:chromosome segregation ATPase|nr:hypothetical protein [Ramlibacter sp.]